MSHRFVSIIGVFWSVCAFSMHPTLDPTGNEHHEAQNLTHQTSHSPTRSLSPTTRKIFEDADHQMPIGGTTQGAQVHVVKNKSAEPLGIKKSGSSPAALDDHQRTYEAHEKVKSLHTSDRRSKTAPPDRDPRPYDFVKILGQRIDPLGKPDATYMEFAQGHEVRETIRQAAIGRFSRESLQNLLEKVAHAIATFHKDTEVQIATYDSQYIKAIQDARNYDYKALLRLISENTQGSDACGAPDSIPPIPEDLINDIKTRADAYLRQVPISGSLTHGDAHAGNLFLPEEGPATFIDYGTMTYSFTRDGKHIGDPGNDVGRLMASIEYDSLVAGASMESAHALGSTFLSDYLRERDLQVANAHTFRESVLFYRDRYFALQFSTGFPNGGAKKAHSLYQLWSLGLQ